jgi:sec-independent protein translocase protein TatB
MYIGPEKIILVLVIGLVVLGPERLPQVARQVGRGYREFRRVTSGLDAEVRQVLHEPLRQAFAEPQPTTAPDPDASSSGTEQTSGAPPGQGSDAQLPPCEAQVDTPPSQPVLQAAPFDTQPLVGSTGDPKLN